jgi:hypothetical protein
MRSLNFTEFLEKLDRRPEMRPNADQAIGNENGKTNNPAALTAAA